MTTVLQKGETHRQELFVAAAVVGAHANSSDKGFRQRDVKFLAELFSNWVEDGLGGRVVPLQNTQIQRFLKSLVREGFARELSRSKLPQYRLTRVGLLELISRMVHRERSGSRQHFFFLYYFIKNYGPRIAELVRVEGRQFPPALKQELTGLLDSRTLLLSEIAGTEAELERLAERQSDATKTSQMMRALPANSEEFWQKVQEAERLYPYELNSQKPLSQLIQEIPEKFQRWELEVGNVRRAEEIWQPARSILSAYRDELKRLLQCSKI